MKLYLRWRKVVRCRTLESSEFSSGVNGGLQPLYGYRLSFMFPQSIP